MYPLLVMKSWSRRVPTILLTALAAASCRTAPVKGVKVAAGAADTAPPPIVQPGAPGEASRVITAAKASDLSRVQYIGADIKFMQGMIGHHEQAVEMVALIPARTAHQDMRLLGKRIDVSQADEINMMRRWLEVRGQQVPGQNAMHMHGATLMPGMLTQEEMARLAAFFKQNGLYVYSHWHSFFTIPPLCITEAELREAFEVVNRALEITDQAVTG